MASLPVNPGHEGFVQPSSYLRPRGQSHPMPHAEPESAIERDQRIGLVCVNSRSFGLYAALPALSPELTANREWRIATDTRVLESEDEL